MSVQSHPDTQSFFENPEYDPNLRHVDAHGLYMNAQQGFYVPPKGPLQDLPLGEPTAHSTPNEPRKRVMPTPQDVVDAKKFKEDDDKPKRSKSFEDFLYSLKMTHSLKTPFRNKKH